MSVKKQIFTKLKDIKTYDELVKHVGIWHDSMLEPERLEQFNTPALMLEFSSIEWSQRNLQFDKSTGRRDANLQFNLHILYRSNKNAYTTFEDSEDLRDSVLRFLPTWYDTQFEQPILTSETTEHSNAVVHDLTLSFRTVAFEPEQTGYNEWEQVDPEDVSLTISRS